MSIRTLIFYALLAGIPAYFFNRYLLKKLKPMESFKNFMLYVAAVLAIAAIYTTAICLVLFKFVWPIN